MASPVDLTTSVFVDGAGISIDGPAGIPPAWPVVPEYCRWMTGDNPADFEALLASCQQRGGESPFDFIGFESQLTAIDRIDSSATSALLVLETHGTRNAHHLFLAAVACARVVTTNFDSRIETAVDWLELILPCFVVSSRRWTPPLEANFLKLHGSFSYLGRRRTVPRVTLDDIGQCGLGFSHVPAIASWFEEITAGATVCVLGYSASGSFDVVPLLEQYCRADRVEWFDFDLTCKRGSVKTRRTGDRWPIPASPRANGTRGLSPEACGKSRSRISIRQSGGFSKSFRRILGPSSLRSAR